jgi:uncharacterized protein
LEVVRREVELAGIQRPALLAGTKIDEAPGASLERLRRRFIDLEVIPVSIMDDASLELLKQEVWRLTGLIRVYLRRAGRVDEAPLAVPVGSTAVDVAASIHKELAWGFRRARVWGQSARFGGQEVGRSHELQEGDIIEIIK